MIQSSTLNFLRSLKRNNNKEWFENNREKYNVVKTNFSESVQSLLNKMILMDPDLHGLAAKDCIFRINRDIRFSKNKTPYKINRSAYFSRGGKKSVFAGYYMHIQPGDKSCVAGGIWSPETAELKKIRQEIDYSLPEFKKLLAASAFKKIYGQLDRREDQMLVNIPKGYDKENPAADFLKMKSFIARKHFTDEEVTAADFEKKVLQSFKALMPLVKFFNRAVE